MPEDEIKICQHPGCNQPGQPCEVPWLYDEPIDKEPKYEYYCAEHAFDHGYCWMCGQYWAGCEGFDLAPSHLCPNCRREMQEEETEEWASFVGELEY